MVNKQRTHRNDLAEMFQTTISSFEREAQRASRALIASFHGSAAKRSARY